MTSHMSSSVSSTSSGEEGPPHNCSGQAGQPVTISIPGGPEVDYFGGLSLARSRSWRADQRVSSRSASIESRLEHYGQPFLPASRASLAPSLSGETAFVHSDVDRSNNKTTLEAAKTHGGTSPHLENNRREKLIIFVFYFWSSYLLTYLALALLSPTSLYYQAAAACLPDGNFNIYYDSYSPWAAEGTFQITMAYGAISFGQAKIIDVIWDVVSFHLPEVSCRECAFWTRHVVPTTNCPSLHRLLVD